VDAAGEQSLKNSLFHLILGGAALQRCDHQTVLNAALAAEVGHGAQHGNL